MRFLRRLSLQYQIAAGVILGVVVLLSIFGWLAVRTIGETRDLALEGRLATAHASAHALDAILVHEAEELEHAAEQMAAMDSDQSEQDLLQQIHAVIDEFAIIVRLDERGKPLWAAPSSFDASTWALASDQAVSSAIQQGTTAIFRPKAADTERAPFAVVVAPIEDEAGDRIGFLVGELTGEEEHLIPLTTLSEGATAFLVDDSGEVIAQAGGEPLTPDTWEPITIEHLVASKQAGTVIDREHGPSHVEAYHPLETLPAGVVVEEREDRALAIPQRMERNMLWIGAGALFVASAGVVLHSRSVVRPLRLLTDASAKIAAGALGDPIHMRREDEVGQLARSFETMRQRLQESQEQRLRWEEELESRVRQRTQEVQSLLRRVISAQEEERMRIARELHDESAQDLLALLAGVQAAEMALPDSPQRAKEVLIGVKPSAKRALEDMRKSILELRPSALDDLGLAPAIRGFAESRLRPANIELRWDAVDELDDLPEPTTITLFRITQAAINNVVQHAQASHVGIRLSSTETHVAIEVQDDGLGFDYAGLRHSPSDTRGLGILGMKERANLIGGTVELDSVQGQGTTVRIRAPIQPGAGNHD